MPSWSKLWQCLERKCNLASITISESLRKASAWLGFSDLNQGGFSCFLGLEGPPNTAARMALPRDMSPVASGKRSHLFSLGDYLGVVAGGVAVNGCSSMQGALGGRMRVGDGGACPSSKWYEVASGPLNDCGLWYRPACQEERTLWWLLLSSLKACSSKFCMYLLHSSCNIMPWEIIWTLASLMALEQATSAAWI